MSSEPKRAANSSEFEVDSQDVPFQSKLKTLRILEGARTSLTIVALLSGITILGVSADALTVYQNTHVPASFLLPLWPENFDLRPTTALVVGSAIVIVANIVSLIFSKAKTLRDRPVVHTSVTFVAPLIGLAAAIIAMAFFYVVNSSTVNETLQSWSCHWRDVNMMSRPHFGTLCKQAQAGLTLAVFLVPLEAVILGIAAYVLVLEKKAASAGISRKSVSPRPS